MRLMTAREILKLVSSKLQPQEMIIFQVLFKKFIQVKLSNLLTHMLHAKAWLIDHIWPVSLQLTYIVK